MSDRSDIDLERWANALDVVWGPIDELSAEARATLEDSRGRVEGRSTPAPHSTAYDFYVWVEWLLRVYPITSLVATPEELLQHPALVAELVGLHRSHKAATDVEADWRDLTAWHESLARAVDRMGEWKTQHSTARVVGAGDDRRWPKDNDTDNTVVL
jgi:hypothetical protein